jgi:hypothetical protein
VLAARGVIKYPFGADNIKHVDASLAQSVKHGQQQRQFVLEWGLRKEAIGLINIVLALPELQGL